MCRNLAMIERRDERKACIVSSWDRQRREMERDVQQGGRSDELEMTVLCNLSISGQPFTLNHSPNDVGYLLALTTVPLHNSSNHRVMEDLTYSLQATSLTKPHTTRRAKKCHVPPHPNRAKPIEITSAVYNRNGGVLGTYRTVQLQALSIYYPEINSSTKCKVTISNQYKNGSTLQDLC